MTVDVPMAGAAANGARAADLASFDLVPGKLDLATFAKVLDYPLVTVRHWQKAGRFATEQPGGYKGQRWVAKDEALRYVQARGLRAYWERAVPTEAVRPG